MGRATGSWLAGPSAAGYATTEGKPFPGERLGLPESGPGAVATTGARFAAIVIDFLVCAVVSAIVAGSMKAPAPVTRALISNGLFFAEVFLLVAITGQTLGMRVLRIRVTTLAGSTPSAVACMARAILLFLLIPALIWDRDRRGLHDRGTGTVVVQA